MATLSALPAARLRRRLEPSELDFTTTADLRDLDEVVGQARAVESLEFGVGMRRQGYNLFVCGPPGTGKQSTVMQLLERRAAGEPVAPDWCYVHRFDDPRKPRAIRLPAGLGAQLVRDMDAFVEELASSVPVTFESEDYHTQREAIAAEYKERREKAFAELAEKATRKSCVLIQTPTGVALAPAREGEVLSHEEFHKLPEAEQERFQADLEALQEELRSLIHRMPLVDREQRQKVRALDRETLRFAVKHPLDELRQRYAAHAEVLEHLDAVAHDVLEHPDAFRETESPSLPDILGIGLPGQADESRLRTRYRVNLLVDHARSHGAPVVVEGRPSHSNLVGRVEHVPQLGALVTNFMLIRSGALHRACGGYLVIDALELLRQPLAWESLKRTLQAGEVRIESLADQLGLLSTVSVEPEPIPLDVKVVLVGERMLYYLLKALDPQFDELFKVGVEFSEDTGRDGPALLLYARLIATAAHREGLRELDRGAVARALEHASRLAGDVEKLSTRVELLLDLVREADHWAGLAGRQVVGAGDVEQAIEARVRRMDRLRERVHEAVRRGTLLIDVGGERVGQVNALSVIDLGGFAFGTPTRITARVRLGDGEVVDIEREVELGGPTHSKGVLILAGFLGGRYLSETPLSLSASLVFEQSYGHVEGDSASLAELCALLSAIAEAPVRQSLAMTGSVNQHGAVQPIGGVNEKVEGFFDVCRAEGLSGEQGVLIPAANVEHLMLRPDVVEAVEQGRFHVWAVSSVDEALELLTGVEPGVPDAEGRFPEGTLNRRVADRLEALAESARSFHRPAAEGEA